ncbi:hypothetical protein DASC09_041870 [Saccharomycopsis crataegensis]|uniref:Zn(2)-C6 fungal-type domain-containing protein n=1 Tax=Saccharomycopsis crataegensis TaxID=43959 RepID=A0AAV5QQV6_9ASCO|nr:hypothetical protein DASC09_041870 [Saccharomycopsis crataegensis]
MMGEKKRKYRKRQSLSCSNCRERKVKCDRNHPCSACTRKGCQTSCTFDSLAASLPPFNRSNEILANENYQTIHNDDSSPKSSASGVSMYSKSTNRTSLYEPTGSDPQILSEVSSAYFGNNPYASDEEVINFYDGLPCYPNSHGNEPVNYGPLSWAYLEIKDVALNLLSEYSNLHYKSGPGGCPKAGYMNENGIWQRPGMNEDSKVSEKPKVFDVFERPDMTEKTLGEELRDYFSNQKLMVLATDVFFHTSLPVTEVIHEKVFRGAIKRVFGELEMQEKPTRRLNISDRTDLSYVGTLLIIVRFAFLLSSPNCKFKREREPWNDPIAEYILTHPVNLDGIALAQKCFQKLTCFSDPSLEMLQFAMFIQFYQQFAPEFGECIYGGKFKIGTGMAFQMAYSLSLNRDPDNCLFSIPEEEKNVRRKLWYTLLCCNLIQSYLYGHPLHYDSLFYDTKAPQNSDKVHCASFYVRLDWLFTPLRSVLHSILDISGNTKMSELTRELSDFEIVLDKSFGSLQDNIDTHSTESCDSTGSIKFWMSLRIFLLSVYNHFKLHYEAKKNTELSFFYTRKIFHIGIVEFLPYLYLFSSEKKVLGTFSEFLVTPFLLQLCHGVSISIFSLQVRLKFAIFNLGSRGKVLSKSEVEIVQALEELSSNIEKCVRVILKCMGNLCMKYYYAYVIRKRVKEYFHVCNGKEFFEIYSPGAIQLRNPPFNIYQLRELNTIVKTGLSNVHKFYCQVEEELGALNAKNSQQPASRSHYNDVKNNDNGPTSFTSSRSMTPKSSMLPGIELCPVLNHKICNELQGPELSMDNQYGCNKQAVQVLGPEQINVGGVQQQQQQQRPAQPVGTDLMVSNNFDLNLDSLHALLYDTNDLDANNAYIDDLWKKSSLSSQELDLFSIIT